MPSGYPAGILSASTSSAHGRSVGSAEQLLVEPVPPPPDRLGQRDRGRRARRDHRRVEAAPAGDEQADADPQDQTARDPEPTLPDLRDRAEVVLEPLPVGRDVVEASADDSRRHGPHRDRAGVVACAHVLGFEHPAQHRHRGDDTESDHQAVGAQIERPELDHAARRRRERGEDGADHCDDFRVDDLCVVNRLANSTVSAKIRSRS